MAGKKKVRLDCRAMPYLQPVSWPDPIVDPTSRFVQAQTRSPIRAAIEAKSDLTFIDDVVRTLQSLGLSEADACSVAWRVLAQPTIAVRRSVNGEEKILQSVILSRRDSDAETQVTIELATVPGRPGSAHLIDADAALVDLDTIEDRLETVKAVELWRENYPLPNESVPEPLPIPAWAWVGDAAQFPLQAQAGWERSVSLLGEVYGVGALIADSPGKLKAYGIEKRVELAFVLRSAKWAATFPQEPRRDSIEVVALRADHDFTFEHALQEVRTALLGYATTKVSLGEEPRNLDPGEIVYHRKTGASLKFDHFDQGSLSPCAHGEDSFKPWSGDKAVKGMARRYKNFVKSMLVHCKHHPNCGMYGVDASRGGIRLQDD